MKPTLDPDIWLCARLSTDIFFKLREPKPGGGFTKFTVSEVRERYCDQCPARAACLTLALEAEGRVGIKERHGIFGGMTAAQRYSFHRRNLRTRCAQCNVDLDPTELRAGRASCEECGFYLTFEPIPDEGDGWSDRHSKLAMDVVAWLVGHVEVNETVPTVTWLSAELKTQRADMRRVFDALVADGTLIYGEDGRTLIRQADSAVLASWRPRANPWAS